MRFLIAIWFAALLPAIGSHVAFGQTKVKLVHATTLEDFPRKKNTTLARGLVEFEYKTTRLYCDSALYFRDTDIIHAYGNVHINQGDTVNIFGDSLKYFGKDNISKLAGHVRFRDNEYKMVTDSLDYFGDRSTAVYSSGAVITSINGDLELTSERGYYNSATKVFYFKKDVKARHPDYSLEADTLEFRTIPQTAHFHSPTKIMLVKSGQRITCEKGIYFTSSSFMRIWQHVTLTDSARTIFADSLEYSQDSDTGEGWGHVEMYDSTEDVKFAAEYMKKWPSESVIRLEKKARIYQYSKSDTLFISADTILHFRDTATRLEKSIAQNHVAIIKADLYASCDSAWFSEHDSIAKLYKEPLMWNNRTQLSADSIFADYYNREFHHVFMHNNAMIVSDHERDSIHYDQMKGQMMTAQLDSGKIVNVLIESNAETLYYVVKTENDSAGTELKSIDGMNRIDCNEIVIYFDESEIQNIAFIDQPTSIYYPIQQVPSSNLFLKGFSWKIDQRPQRQWFD